MDFRAVGDGVTNDRAAVNAAISYALAAGFPIDGGDRLYAVDDDIIIARKARPFIKQIRLKNIAPANDSQVLHLLNCEQVRIDSLYIHTGDTAEVGDRESRSGLRIEGGSGHRVRNVELTGKGKGRYAFFWRCKDSIFENIYVHDGLFQDTSIHNGDPRIMVEDDVVEGIRIDDCFNCTVLNPVVRDLLGNATYYTASGFVPGNYPASAVKAFPNMRTRGISGGGNDGLSLVNPRISNVDQGIDFSGSGGNWGNKTTNVIGGHTLNCASVGLKYGGQPQNLKVIGHVAENCGMYGFLAGGSTGHYKAHGYTLLGCTALNPGYNDIHVDAGDVIVSGRPNRAYIQNAHCGFLIFAPSDDGIEDVSIANCKAVDRQGFYLAGDDPWEPENPTTTWPGVGATTAYMQFPWTGYTGTHQAKFKTSGGTVSKTVTLTSGSNVVTWAGGLGEAVSHPFVSLPPKMQFGFMAINEAGTALAFNQSSRRPLTLEDDCESVGHIVARAFGFHWDVCHVRGRGPQRVETGVMTPVEFHDEADDTMAMHETSSAEERIYPKRPGSYRVRGMVSWDASQAGYRKVEVRKNESQLYGMLYPAVQGDLTVCPFDCEVEITQADIAVNTYISVWAEQTSGKSLSLRPDRWMKVERTRAR